ncbi:MAG: hypothetical protein ACJ72C_10160 [Nitrososphaeraceae archaeon]
MSNISSKFAILSALASVMLFSIWSNIDVYAQQSSQHAVPASSPPISSSLTNSLSLELKAKMCDPSNPSLKVVNTTESTICGIPKTVKPPSLSAAMPPPTSAVISSSSPPQQTTTTKPTTTTTAGSVAALPKQQQQQIATTSNNTAISQSTGGATGATIATVSNPSNTSLSSPPTIAPQVNAISQQQPQPVTAINGTAAINSTAGQNYPFATTTQAVASGKLMYLGYHSDDGTPITDSDSSPKHKSSSSDTKSSSHNDDGGSKSSSSELASAIRNKADSIIKNSFDDNDESGDSFFGGDKFFSDDDGF